MTMNGTIPSAEGYLNDQPWTYGYHSQQSPHYLNMALAIGGHEPVCLGSYCELAFGHGVSLVIHAAANPGTRFEGTDFNPLHLEFARQLAGEDLPNLALNGLSFSEFFRSAHSGPFNIVSMTGTWSWVPETEQRRILGFLKDGLKPRGVFCHDNMVLPGNTATTALRQMLMAFATHDPAASPGNPDRALPAVKRAIELIDTNPSFINLFSDTRDTLETLLSESPHHLSHEYLNYNWTARHFLDTAQMMRETGLQFVAARSLSQSCDALQFTSRQSDFLKGVSSPELREQVKDYMQCRSIRFDMWSRDRLKAGSGHVMKLLDDLQVIMVKPLSGFGWVASGSSGDFDLDRNSYGPIVDCLAQGEPTAIRELRKISGHLLTDSEFIMFLAILIDQEWVSIAAHDESGIAAASAACQAVNTRILALEAEGRPLRALASPVTGSGIEVPSQHFTFLRARRAGASTPGDYAQFAAAEHRGKQAHAEHRAQANPEFFLARAREFDAQSLPIYRKLMVD